MQNEPNEPEEKFPIFQNLFIFCLILIAIFVLPRAISDLNESQSYGAILVKGTIGLGMLLLLTGGLKR
jgi:hypothetical protein